jgi:hypothetical protein
MRDEHLAGLIHQRTHPRRLRLTIAPLVLGGLSTLISLWVAVPLAAQTAPNDEVAADAS